MTCQSLLWDRAVRAVPRERLHAFRQRITHCLEFRVMAQAVKTRRLPDGRGPGSEWAKNLSDGFVYIHNMSLQLRINR